eukprot:1799357-Pyramimonas_sp.AAC.1
MAQSWKALRAVESQSAGRGVPLSAFEGRQNGEIAIRWGAGCPAQPAAQPMQSIQNGETVPQ